MPEIASRPHRSSAVRRRRHALADINTASECLLFLVSAMFGANRPCRRNGGRCGKIGDLILFLRRRFALEDRAMREAGYPAADAHRAEHQAILGRLRTLHRTLECGRYDTDAILAFIESWAIGHIESHDKPLGHFLTGVDADGVARGVRHREDRIAPH